MIANRQTNEAASNSAAIAPPPRQSYSSTRVAMSYGANSVLNANSETNESASNSAAIATGPG